MTNSTTDTTTTSSSSSTIDTDQLPATVRAFLAAHAAGEHDAALRAFTPDAVITDEGHTFTGTAQVAGFLSDAGAEWTYTTELVGAERVDEEHWVAVLHLEGDFPGGVVDLRYRFTLADDLVARLDIAP